MGTPNLSSDEAEGVTDSLSPPGCHGPGACLRTQMEALQKKPYKASIANKKKQDNVLFSRTRALHRH